MFVLKTKDTGEYRHGRWGTTPDLQEARVYLTRSAAKNSRPPGYALDEVEAIQVHILLGPDPAKAPPPPPPPPEPEEEPPAFLVYNPAP